MKVRFFSNEFIILVIIKQCFFNGALSALDLFPLDIWPFLRAFRIATATGVREHCSDVTAGCRDAAEQPTVCRTAPQQGTTGLNACIVDVEKPWPERLSELRQWTS